MAEEKRVSSHIQCPRCERVIEKSAQYQIFAGARGIGMASSADDACPYCRAPISIQGILDGRYDYWPPKMSTGRKLAWAIGGFLAVVFLSRACGG